MAAFFFVDAGRYAIDAIRETDRSSRRLSVLAALGNGAVAVLVIVGREWAVAWMVAVAGALRIFGIAWNIIVAPIHTAADADETVVAELGLADSPRHRRHGRRDRSSEAARAPIDRGWTLAFIATLFAIHIGRMGTDRTLLGFVAPGGRRAGDMFIAVSHSRCS